MFKRSQKKVSDGSKHWYQDRYQHVLTQRNVLALVALVALVVALVAVLAVARLAPLKSVQPYLLQIDEKTGITRKVEPVSRRDYAASEAIDRFFTSTYLRARESYNVTTLRYNYNVVRLLCAPEVFYGFRRQVDPANPASFAALLGATGQREIKIRSMNYLVNPPAAGAKSNETIAKIMQARITTTNTVPNKADVEEYWVVTIGFEYANLSLNETEQLINPLGYTVTSYQIQREVN